MKKFILLAALLVSLGTAAAAQNVVRYKIVYKVSKDGQKFNAPAMSSNLVFLNFTNDKSSFFICDADGYRILQGGFADVQTPQGGTGYSTTGWNPIDYHLKETRPNGIRIYTDRRPVIDYFNNRSIYYTTDVFKFSKDYSRINVKVEVGQRAPLGITDVDNTYVLERMGNPASSNDVFY